MLRRTGPGKFPRVGGKVGIVALIVELGLPCPCGPRARTGRFLHRLPVKLLLDLLPVVIFFGAFRLFKALSESTVSLAALLFGTLGGAADQQLELSAVLLATVCAIVATLAQIAWLRMRRQPIKASVWISAVLIVIFGGLTIWFHNEWFIKWKPSILYWTFASVLLLGKWVLRRNLLGSLLSAELELPPRIWDHLLYAWAAFFALLGFANIYVAYHWSTADWVNFKTFGLLGLTFAYSLLTGVYMARHLAPVAAPAGEAGAAPDARAVPPSGTAVHDV